MSWPLILAALVAGGIGIAIGWPAWQAWQSRAARDRNAERYRAWRGRTDRAEPAEQAMTPSERRRVITAVGLGGVAVACLVIGLSSG